MSTSSFTSSRLYLKIHDVRLITFYFLETWFKNTRCSYARITSLTFFNHTRAAAVFLPERSKISKHIMSEKNICSRMIVLSVFVSSIELLSTVEQQCWFPLISLNTTWPECDIVTIWSFYLAGWPSTPKFLPTRQHLRLILAVP